ncbi:hypothetical protein GCM10027294_26490 [Marinactinospora endophytica]
MLDRRGGTQWCQSHSYGEEGASPAWGWEKSTAASPAFTASDMCSAGKVPEIMGFGLVGASW